MKIKKIFAVLAATFVIAFSASAFDGATFWKEYGAGIENGDNIVGVGVSYGWGLNVNASYEKAVHINDMLPFTFGAEAGLSFVPGGMYVDAEGLAKYHFNFGVEHLDVFAGLAVGVALGIGDADLVTPFFPSIGGMAGATWMFTDNMGVTLEGGYPYYGNLKFTMKF